jgi:hypothetical protein
MLAVDERSLYEDPELYDRLFPAAQDMSSTRDEARRRLMFASERFYLDEALKGGGRGYAALRSGWNIFIDPDSR